MLGVIFSSPIPSPLPPLEASFGGLPGSGVIEKTTLESLVEVLMPMSESSLLSIYQYLLSITSLFQVAHPTSARSTGNRIQDQISRQYEGVTLSVPLKVVQSVVDIIPARVLSVFVADPVKFFGLNALCHINYARMGGSGEFVANVTRTFYDKAVQKAPKIILVERWMVPDDLLEPLRLLISVVLLSNVTYGLCLLGLSGVVSRRFSDLRATHTYDRMELCFPCICASSTIMSS